MKLLKVIGSAALILLCLGLLAFSGYFLISALPRERTDPPALDTEQLFDPMEAADPAAPEEAAAEEPAPEPAEAEPEPEPEPEPVYEEIPEPEEPPEEDAVLQARAYLETMTLDEKLWQLFFITPDALTGQSPVQYATEWTKAALAEKPVGGLVYFSSNLADRKQITEMLTWTQSYAKTPLFLAVDEEGGLVSRLGALENSGVTYFGPAADYGAAGDTGAVYAMGSTLASQMGALGFNLDFAPVADVVTNPNNTEIGSRAYSSDPGTAAEMVSAMVRGLQEGNMLSCLKHFPGHGSTEANSHDGTSVSTRTLEELRAVEWTTFRAGIDAGAAFVMISHLTNENLSPDPCSLSAAPMEYLRQELGFDGIIITDSLQMGAIVDHYTSAQAAVMAVDAGADMLLMPNDAQLAHDALAAALDQGTLTEARIDESVLRILTAKYRFGIMGEA